MTKIDLTDSPRDIFIAAARDAAYAGLVLEEAKKKIADEEAAAENARANLQWVAAHPALAEVDKAALYQEATANLTLADLEAPAAPAAEPETPAEEAKPKRKRRTKAEIEADKAREPAEKAPAPEANESDDAAQQVEGQGVSTPAPAAQPDTAFDPFGTAAQAPAAQPAAPVQQAPAPVAAAPAPAPAAVPGGSDPFDPFGTGA